MNYTNGLPKGTIVMWYGTPSDIPDGWDICDGSNGTPDLRDKFIVAAGGKYDLKKTGGQDTVTLSEAQMPSHQHSYTRFTSYGYAGAGQDKNHEYVDYHKTDKGIKTDKTGDDQPHENRPPFYALYFIMRII